MMNTRTVSAIMAFAFSICYLPTSRAEDSTEKGTELLLKESLGGLKLSMKPGAVLKLMTKPEHQGKVVVWEATGEYMQEWAYPAKGITLMMGAAEKKGPQTVSSITAKAPSTLSTLKGVHIGSTEKEVRMAYSAFEDKENSKTGETFVAGSIYGGIIFTFEKGLVSQIFFGAGAE